MEEKVYAIYIMTSYSKQPLYTGVTGNLLRRYWEHRQGLVKGFTSKYRARYLLYYELFGEPELAIQREKQIKGWKRAKKIALIATLNPDWNDLGEELLQHQ